MALTGDGGGTWLVPLAPQATAVGESSGTTTNEPLLSWSRSTETILGSSAAGVVDTNSVASARP